MYTTQRIIGLKKVLEANNLNVDAAAFANTGGEEREEGVVEKFLSDLMFDIEQLIKVTPEVKDG